MASVRSMSLQWGSELPASRVQASPLVRAASPPPEAEILVFGHSVETANWPTIDRSIVRCDVHRRSEGAGPLARAKVTPRPKDEPGDWLHTGYILSAERY